MPEEDPPVPPVIIKKYANRRLYDTESSIYITLDTLADMVRQGRDFVVYDAKNGDDITRAVLTQIIMEEETRGRNMLPTAFLRQLIGFYGDSAQGLVPDYLERMMDQFAAQQREIRTSVQRGVPVRSVADRALGLFPPFVRAASEGEEMLELRAEIARLREDLAHARAGLAEPVPVARTGGVRH